MVSDKNFSATMGIKTNKILVKQLEEKIQKCENELKVLGGISLEAKWYMNRSSRVGVEQRVNYLGRLLSDSSRKLMELEEEMKEWKKSLSRK